MTKYEVLIATVPLRELGVPGGRGTTVPASLVAVYSQRIGGYTQRSTFVADIQVSEIDERLYFQSPEVGEWRSVLPDELPKAKVMITLQPYDGRIWRGTPKFDQNVSPIAVYVLL